MTRPLQRINLGILAAVVAGSTLSSLVTTTQVNAAVDCTNDAVIQCGITYSVDRRGAQDFRRDVERDAGLYELSHEAQQYLRQHGGTVNIARGQLARDGYITVGGEVVARESRTYGRMDRDDRQRVTFNNATYYRAPASEFVEVNRTRPVYVMLTSNGEYIASVMESCGNPISARPVETPTPPAPTPETPAPTPETPAPTPVTPTTPAPVTPAQPVVQPVETPKAAPVEMPQVLASTGIADVLGKGVGLSSLTALIAYALTSRRRLF